MPGLCSTCGKESLVLYVKADFKRLCCECEDLERERNPDSWEKMCERMNSRYERRY